LVAFGVFLRIGIQLGYTQRCFKSVQRKVAFGVFVGAGVPVDTPIRALAGVAPPVGSLNTGVSSGKITGVPACESVFSWVAVFAWT